MIDIDVPDRDANVILGFAEATSSNPTREVNSAIDLFDWLATLPARDRKMLELRAAGHTWKVAGAAVGMPLRSAFDRCKRLGMELAERMGARVDVETRTRRRADPAAQLLHAASPWRHRRRA
jgi:hypothetical protein